MSYLTTWKSAIPPIQANWISTMIQQQLDQGSLTEDQVSQETIRLTNLINQGDTRTLSTFLPAAPDTLINAESCNYMLTTIAGDLQAGFQEAYNIGLLTDTYQKLYTDRFLSELKDSLDYLESEIARIKYLQEDSYGFNGIQISKFSKTGYFTPRSHSLASYLFQDPRSNQSLPVANDCSIDLQGGTLILPVANRLSLSISNIEISNKAITSSLGGKVLDGTALSHIIDKQTGTFWIWEEATSKPSPNGMEFTFKFILGGLQTFSYVEVQPVADFPLYVVNISYEDGQGNIISLIDGETAPALMSPVIQPVKFHTPLTRGKAIQLTVKQQSYIHAQLNTLFPKSTNSQECCIYSMGLDNVLVGKESYLNTGIYISPAYTISNCQAIGLVTTEENTGRFGAIEYYLIKIDYGNNGKVIRINRVPILPIGRTSVAGEVMVWKYQQSLTSSLSTRFCAHLDGEALSFNAYESSRLLAATEYDFTGSLADTLPTAYKLNYPIAAAYYTIDYVPAHLQSGDKYYLDNNQELYLSGSNIINCKTIAGGVNIYKSDLYLAILIRGNTDNLTISPGVLEWKLLTNS